MEGFLSQEEVEYLTGFKQVDKQSKWLALEGISFFVSRDTTSRGNKTMKCVVAWNAVLNGRNAARGSYDNEAKSAERLLHR